MTGRWRAMRDHEVEAVVAFSVQLYVEDPGARVITDRDVRRTLLAFAEEPARGRCVVLDVPGRAGRAANGVPKQGGGVCGYAFLVAFWSNELGGEVCVVDEFYVAEDVRGQGHGTALIEALKDGVPTWFRRAVALELEVTPTNARARALYERMGFAPKKNATLRLLR